MILRRADIEHVLTVFVVAALMFWILTLVVYGKDNGQWKGNPLKPWFDSLASKKGLCCSFADGFPIKDVQWDTEAGGRRYRVYLDNQWVPVPDSALVEGPNYAGVPMVWPYRDADGALQIRCFIPGSGS